MKYAIVLVIASMAVGAMYVVEDNPPPSRTTRQVIPNLIRAFDHLMQSHFQLSGTPGAAMTIVGGNQTLFTGTYGVRNLATHDPVTSKTVFRLGSVSKGFAGILAHLVMQQDSNIAFTDTVTNFLPSFGLSNPKHGNDIQIRHLLSHSTGLRGHTFTHQLERGETLNELLPRFRSAAMEGPTGFHQYQNAAFALVEPILAKRTGHSFKDLLINEIFIPLGMNRASTSFEEMDSLRDKAYPHDYRRWSGDYVVEDYNQKYYNVVAAGGVNASIEDMAIWLKALLGHRREVIPPETIRAAFTSLTSSQSDPRSPNKWDGVTETAYASGWRVIHYHGRSLLYHGGYVNNFRSEIVLDTTYQTGFCALFNASSTFSNTVVPTYLDFLELYRDLTLTSTEP